MCQTELTFPGTFSALVLCEPILVEADVNFDDPPSRTATLSERTAKRKHAWGSVDEAASYFASRPMFRNWQHDALQGTQQLTANSLITMPFKGLTVNPALSQDISLEVWCDPATG